MDKNIGVDVAKLASLQTDQLKKLQSGQMTIEHIEWFNNLSKNRRNRYVTNKKLFFPKEFFQTREALWISDDFKKYILLVAKSIEKTKTISVSLIDFEKSMTDEEIRAELSESYIFNTDEFCLYLADKIQQQSKGKEEGKLFLNGYTNIFYVRGKSDEVFMVVVVWDVDGRGWLVCAYRSVTYRWRANSRVFSCN